MSQTAQPAKFPEGLSTPLVTGLTFLSLKRNMVVDSTESAILVSQVSGKYEIIIDSGYRLNGLYFIDITLNSKKLGILVAVSGRITSSYSPDTIENSVNILSAVNEDPTSIIFNELTLKGKADGTVGLLLSFNGVGTTVNASIEISSINATTRIQPTLGYTAFTQNVSQRKYGYVNALEVKDDSVGVNIDLSSINRPSMIFANPATAGSRPPGTSGKGICHTLAGSVSNVVGAQLFAAEGNQIYYRIKAASVWGTWAKLVSTNEYPKVVKSGTTLISVSENGESVVDVPGIDLTKERYVVHLTPERTVGNRNTYLQMQSRGDGFFTVSGRSTTAAWWEGRLNWSVIESRPAGFDATYNILLGIWNGTTFTESSSVSEGQTLRIRIETTNVENGTELPFSISGTISASDITAPLSGVITINNNFGYMDIDIVQDYIPESTETLRVTLSHNPSIYKQINVLDVSSAQVFNLKVSNVPNGSGSVSSGDEGDTLYLVLDTQFVGNGTLMNFNVSDTNELVDAGDLLDYRSISNNRLIVPFTLENLDSKPYEGPKTVTFSAFKSGDPTAVATVNLNIVDKVWAGSSWYSTSAGSTVAITEANEGDTIYFNLRVPSGTAIGEAFKVRFKDGSHQANPVATPGVDIDLSNSSDDLLLVKAYTGSNEIISVPIHILTDSEAEPKEYLFAEWIYTSNSNVVGGENRSLGINNVGGKIVKTLTINGETISSGLDLRARAIAALGSQTAPWLLRVTVLGTTWITSNNLNTPAIKSDGWLAGTDVEIYWNGTGGAIGKGGTGVDTDPPAAETNGGSLFYVQPDTTMKVIVGTQNVIFASGGGGGSSLLIKYHPVGSPEIPEQDIRIAGGGGAAFGASGVTETDYEFDPKTGISHGSVATRTEGALGDTLFTEVGVNAMYGICVGGRGGDPGLNGSDDGFFDYTGDDFEEVSETDVGLAGQMNSGTGTLTIERDGTPVTTSVYFNSNSYIRGRWS